MDSIIEADASLLGWGASCGEQHGWPMVSAGGDHAHQWAGVAGGNTGSEGLCEGHEQCLCFAEAGQHDGCLLHQPQGWDSVPQPDVADEEPLALVHGEKHHAAGSALARQTQCGGRRGVQDTDRQVRLEPGLCSVRATGCTVGATEGGLVRFQADKAISVFQLETRPAGSGHGCLSAAMEKSGSISESSLELGGEDTDDLDASGSENCAGDSCVDGAALVPNTAGDGDRGAENAATTSIGSESLIHGDTFSSRMAHIRRACTVQKLSEEASTLVECSWRKR